MTLVEVAPSDELRAILWLKFDRRAPYDAAVKFKQGLIDCSGVALTLEASGASNLSQAAPAAIRRPSNSTFPPPAEEALRARDSRTVPATTSASRREWIR